MRRLLLSIRPSRLSSLVQDLTGTAADLTLGFTYNPASQILSNTRSNDAYSWTGHGNGTTASSVNGLNQLTSVGGTAITHDGRGNLTSDGTRTFGYTAENRLETAPGTTLAYDALGRLFHISSTVTDFRYDGGDIIEETEAYTTGTQRRRFVWGPGANEPLVSYEGSGTGTRRWFHADERGSTIAMSDAAGNAVSINAYDEYGRLQGASLDRFQYTGQMWLPEIGMYHYKARMYDPASGRFLQADPIGYGDGMNMYGYVKGDPVNFTDPSGTQMRLEESGGCGHSGERCHPDLGPVVAVITGNPWTATAIGEALMAGDYARNAIDQANNFAPTGDVGYDIPSSQSGVSLLSQPIFPTRKGAPTVLLSDAKFEEIKIKHVLPVNPLSNKSYFFSYFMQDKDTFSKTVIVPALQNPNLQITNFPNFVEIRSDIGRVVGVDIFGDPSSTVIIRGVGGSVGDVTGLIISNVLLGQ